MIRNDEKDWVADILATHIKPDKMTYYQLIRFIAMYYYDDWHELKQAKYSRNVLDIMQEFNFDYTQYQEWKYVDYARRFCKKLIDGKVRRELLDIKSVCITKNEIQIIRSASTEKEQKLMFTFYVLAKVNLMPTGWINYSLKDVFDAADIRTTKLQRHLMIHSLYTQKLIQLNEYPDKRGYKVELQHDNTELTISNFQHLGKQYLDRYKDGWVMCKRCFKMIKMKAPNQKYCTKCANVINQEQTKERMRKVRMMFDSEKSLQPA